jgi:HEAT repeat protein
MRALNDPEMVVRRSAAKALGQIAPMDQRTISALLAKLKDPAQSVRVAAEAALDTARPADKETVSVLLTALRERDESVQRVAAATLERIDPWAEEAVPDLIRALKDQEMVVRRSAAKTLGTVAGPAKAALPALVNALKDESHFVRAAAAHALGKIDPVDRRALPALIDALKDPQLVVRDSADIALRTIRPASKEAVLVLLAALRQQDGSVRRIASAALQRIDPTADDVVPILVDALTDPAPSVQRATGFALVGIDSTARVPVPTLIAALAEKDSSSLLRRRAIRHLASIATNEESVRALTDALEDDDAEVRHSAALGLERIRPRPLVEKYLHAGELAKGEQALEAALAVASGDDQLRFSLGVLQFIRGVERLGQSLYRYGVRPTNIPFVRLPVPKNPAPAVIRYSAFRHMLDDFHRDLSEAEVTLAGVTDDRVKLPVRLAGIRLDLDGKGKPTDRFIDLMQTIMHQEFRFLETNPDFLVCFDRGDVAWLRAYCHLLMGMLDFYLAFDTEALFDLSADELFARPEKTWQGTEAEKRRELVEGLASVIRVKEPVRLGRFREHLVKVAKLNRETWRYILAEKDDDHEWLPNPQQTGVLGLPVRREMIDGWLAAIAEVEALLEGKKVFPQWFGLEKNGKGLNLRALLDDPPKNFEPTREFFERLPDKYWSKADEVDMAAIMRISTLFGDTTAVAYVAWFN